MAKKRPTPRKTPCKGIANIIAYLTQHHENHRLCGVGIRRLDWWNRNRLKFPSIKAALRTWSVGEVRAWFNFANIPYKELSMDEEDINNMLDELEILLSPDEWEKVKALKLERVITVADLLEGLDERQLQGKALSYF